MTDEERDYVRRLFGDDDAPDPQPEPADPVKDNHVPREGSNTRKRPADYDDRDFAGELFGVHPNQRNLYNPDN